MHPFMKVCIHCRLHSHGIPCPEVVLLRKHVLIMSFIGKDNCPAPKLKDSNLSAEQLKSAYHQCVQVRGVVSKSLSICFICPLT